MIFISNYQESFYFAFFYRHTHALLVPNIQRHSSSSRCMYLAFCSSYDFVCEGDTFSIIHFLLLKAHFTSIKNRDVAGCGRVGVIKIVL